MSGVLHKLQKDTPSITVLMSVFNGALFLHEAIESVLNQTFTDFEFIIVDDGSLDNSVEIIRRCQLQDPRISLISKTNTGLADSLNHGIQKARGEWIARLDADDLCEPTRLAKQILLAEKNPNLVFIGTGLTIINEKGTKKTIYNYPERHQDLLKQLQIAGKFPPHSSAFYLTKVVRALGGYRPRIKRSQDLDLWLRLSAVGELACIGEPLVQLRQHARQISNEETGKRQLYDARIGMVSYWLRCLGVRDPVDADEKNFYDFKVWLHTRLDAAGFFEYQVHVNYLRLLIHKSSKSNFDILKLLVTCFSHPIFSLHFIWNNIFGESITRRLAFEWVMQRKE